MARRCAPAIPTIENLYRESKTAADKAMVSFPSDLERACADAKVPIDRTSREPHYTFQNGFLELEIDTGKHLAHVKDREAKLVTLPADVGAVVEAVAAEHQRLFERPFDGERFLRKLRSHYLAVLKKEGLKDGEVLPIRRITHRLGKNEKGFHTDEFLIDLSRLAEEGPLESDDVKLDLQQTKDTNQGMLLAWCCVGRLYRFHRVPKGLIWTLDSPGKYRIPPKGRPAAAGSRPVLRWQREADRGREAVPPVGDFGWRHYPFRQRFLGRRQDTFFPAPT